MDPVADERPWRDVASKDHPLQVSAAPAKPQDQWQTTSMRSCSVWPLMQGTMYSTMG